jgi:hypothetical protein
MWLEDRRPGLAPLYFFFFFFLRFYTLKILFSYAETRDSSAEISSVCMIKIDDVQDALDPLDLQRIGVMTSLNGAFTM